MATRDDVSYWTSIKSDDFMSLRDYQSLDTGGSGGVDYHVADVRRIGIHDRDGGHVIAEYHIYDLVSEGRTLFFVVVKVEKEFELRTYFMPNGFISGTRDDLIDHGHTWFFLPPSDPEDFISSDLEYAPYPDVPPVNEDGKITRREFGPSGFGKPVYGTFRRSGEDVPVIIAEYKTEDEDALNPLLLILEERWVRPDGSIPEEGGLTTPLLGCVVQPEVVELYPA